MYSIDLTNDNPITPEMVAQVRAGMEEERRSGADRRAESRVLDACCNGGRRASDHKPATPEEVARICRRLEEES